MWQSKMFFGSIVTMASCVAGFAAFGISMFAAAFVCTLIAAGLAYKFHTLILEQHTKQICEASRMHLATVEALATAIDARDQVGAGHVRRTQIYALGLGRVLNLAEDEINALRTGALLHDIGKLAVPDHILNKPGKLTDAEMEKAKIHSSVGASILEKIGFSYPVVPTVKYHHEFWDGTGYPENLKGNKIPLTARILTIADAFDSLRGARPYRSAVSREDACKHLRALAGTQFDPKLVTTFLHNLRDFEDEIDAEGLAYDQSGESSVEQQEMWEEPSAGYVEQIKSANREVYTLYEMAKEFSSSLDHKETLSLFTKKIRELVPFDTCVVYLLDESGEFATAVHVEGNNDSALLGKQIKTGEGSTGYVLANLKPVENVDPSMDFAFFRENFSNEYAGMVSLPLIADERLIGAVSLYSSELAVYQEEHLRVLETISSTAADAILKSVQHAESTAYALTDLMTSLPNARSLQQQFEKEVARADRAGNSFQVIMLDLDGFKAVNDTFGHKTGDKMLKQISLVIREQLREYDFLARYGGDEFVALIPETGSSDVLELCRRIELAVSEFDLPVGLDSVAKVGVSIGAASYPNHGESFDQMIIAADKAMYSTKAYRKQRKAELIETAKVAEPVEVADSPLEVAAVIETVPVEFSFDEGLVLELDESHIVSYSAVN
ncbi:MAG: GTP cyclohydrolase IIa [Pyrinomonadaceae bacterium]